MKTIILSIDGMTCAACSVGLEKYISKQDGIENISVNLVLQNAKIDYDEKKLDIEQIEKLIKKAGFKSLGIYNANFESKKTNYIYLIISSILAIIMMYISMGSMIGLPEIKFFSMNYNPINYVLIQICLLIYFLIYGFDILKSGFLNLVHLAPNMDSLVLISVFAGSCYSIYMSNLVICGNFHMVHNLYFESCALVIYFIKLGKTIEKNAIGKTRNAISNLVQLTPNKALKKEDGKIIEVPIADISKGDILVAKPGMKIAVDGNITKGYCHIDESLISRESKPVKKQIKDTVIAGSININGNIEYVATRIGKDSTISQIITMVVDAMATKPKFSKTVDKVSSYFVPVIIIIAVLTLFIYLIAGKGVSSGLIHFMNVLVVACPCSLGLATPLAIVVAQGLCAKSGIFVKNSQVFEKAKKVDVVVLDKTGTLTNGNLNIFKIYNFTKTQTDKQLLKTIASIENMSSHPIKNAFLNYIEDKNLKLYEVRAFEEFAGLGLTGIIDGKKIVVGNSKILEKYEIKNKYKKYETSLAKQGCSIVYLAIENEIVAVVGIKDLIKKDSKRLIQVLKNHNITPIMLTRDNKIASDAIAKEIGIENVISNVMPKTKKEEIQKLQKENKVCMMVGDGINDSIALTLANVGVSFSNGTDIAIDVSDVVINNSNLLNVYNIILISKKTLNIIYENLVWAFIYNLAMIPIAIGLFSFDISPMLGSIAMVLSSICVVLNSLRLNFVKTLK